MTASHKTPSISLASGATKILTVATLLVTVIGACFVASPAAASDGEPIFSIHMRNEKWSYSHEELEKLATGPPLSNMRGTRMKPTIPIEELIKKDTGLSVDQIKRVVFLREDGMPIILRGEALNYLDKLVLSGGPEKSNGPHPWALAPEDEATHEVLIRDLGARRKHLVNRIDISPLDSLEP